MFFKSLSRMHKLDLQMELMLKSLDKEQSFFNLRNFNEENIRSIALHLAEMKFAVDMKKFVICCTISRVLPSLANVHIYM